MFREPLCLQSAFSQFRYYVCMLCGCVGGYPASVSSLFVSVLLITSGCAPTSMLFADNLTIPRVFYQL